MPQKPWPPERCASPLKCTSMSSQWFRSSAIFWPVTGSAWMSPSSVASENTTPQPNVSSGLLRSNTVIWCPGSRSFIRMAK